jgi:hypothetical protein
VDAIHRLMTSSPSEDRERIVLYLDACHRLGFAPRCR